MKKNINKKIVALILARGGSKGIPGKNIKELSGKPLIAYTIKAAQNATRIEEVYVSTDCEDVAMVSKKYGATVIERPSELASDEASSESALLHFAENVDFDVLVFLQCTSPFTMSEDIDAAIEKFSEGYDSVLSVCEDRGGFLCGGFRGGVNGESVGYAYKNRPRRQDMDMVYRENGALYVMSRKGLIDNRNRLCGNIGLYRMPGSRSFEIDEPGDFEMAEIYMREIGKRDVDTKVLKGITLAIFDVDGVFTDGSVYVEEDGKEQIRFSRLDGKGVELLREKGVIVAILSSEDLDQVRFRMKKLQIEDIHLGVSNKLKVYEELKAKYSIEDKDVCFCGDDVQDIDVLRKVGFSACPKNAQDSVKNICAYVSGTEGGSGFVREICAMLIDTKE